MLFHISLWFYRLPHVITTHIESQNRANTKPDTV